MKFEKLYSKYWYTRQSEAKWLTRQFNPQMGTATAIRQELISMSSGVVKVDENVLMSKQNRTEQNRKGNRFTLTHTLFKTKSPTELCNAAVYPARENAVQVRFVSIKLKTKGTGPIRRMVDSQSLRSPLLARSRSQWIFGMWKAGGFETHNPESLAHSERLCPQDHSLEILLDKSCIFGALFPTQTKEGRIGDFQQELSGLQFRQARSTSETLRGERESYWSFGNIIATSQVHEVIVGQSIFP
jgi:hypothetical protein